MANEAPKPSVQVPERDAGHIPITEEMDSARWTLPPATPVIVVVIVLACIVGLFAWIFRAKPAGSGAITGVYAVEVPNQNSVLVEVQVQLKDVSQKPLWVRDVKATVKTPQGEYSDEAASQADFQRYFQAFPELAQHKMAPLAPETKISPGGQTEGMVIVSFPVTKEQFEQRQSLSVTIQPYDQRSVMIAEKK
jgi:hypothetical protein